jgi:Zn-dependent protease with chaperone function
VTVGAALLLYAVAVGVVLPVGLRRRPDWLVRAPRLGAAAMLAAAWSVLLALVLAGATVALPTSALTPDLAHLIGACLARLRAAYSSPGGLALVVPGQLLSLGLLTRILWVGGWLTLVRRTERRRHRLLVRLAGQRMSDGPVVVLDSPAAAAYSIAGRHPAVIVTRGTMALLSTPQLDAVLAHEHAHLHAGHHRRLAAAALAARSLPFVPLLRETPGRLARLLEMEADELAALDHEPRVLASALVTVGAATSPSDGAGTTGGAVPLAAAGSDAAARVRRLLRPPGRLPRRQRTLTRTAVVVLATTPLVLAAAPGLLSLR